MAVTGRDAAYEDPLIHCGAWPTRDRMPPRRVLLSESKASRRVAAKGCTAQCVDIDVGRADSARGLEGLRLRTRHRAPAELPGVIRAEKPRLVLLDLMLPGTDGIELMKRVPELADLPVIFIFGYGRDETIAKALESGAADYIVKPFSPTELVARVQAALRARTVPEIFVHGDLAVDYGRRRVSVAGREVPLTITEFELLRILSLNGGRVVTTEALLRQVWGRRGSDDTDHVRTVVKKLRHKLGDDAANPTYIFNEHGVGYRIATPGGA